MVGVAVQTTPDRTVEITTDTNIYHAFKGVTEIVFAYCKYWA